MTVPHDMLQNIRRDSDHLHCVTERLIYIRWTRIFDAYLIPISPEVQGENA